ncbi:MAG: hypothetical protein IBX72_14460 [Nitrospirae bacterium]|jgi:hypothetical protein|nr:hypothetical protein [Nitrospirota bacterium]
MVGKDIINTLKDILLLKEKVSTLSEVTKDVLKKLDNHNDRIIRLETKFEIYEALSKRK